MRLRHISVPIGKTVVIGHEENHDVDVVGFIEPSGKKMVSLDHSLYQDYADNVCNNCKIHFVEHQEIAKYKESYLNLFRVHPDMCIDILNDLDLYEVMWCAFYNYEIEKSVWYRYAKKGFLTPEYFVNGLLKWGEYESFLTSFVHSSLFKSKVLLLSVDFLYQKYDKCKGFVLEGTCKKKEPILTAKKIPCDHNNLLILQDLGNDTFYFYDWKHDAPLALPNVYSDGHVCWGANPQPNTLQEALNLFFQYPFNGDLLLDSEDSSVSEMIDEYGFDSSEFYPYDERYDCTDYDAEARDFTTDEIITIIENGGDNQYKGSLDLESESFDIEGVCQVLIVEDGRKIPEFAELIDDDFMSFLDDFKNLHILLINDLGGNIWEAYLPTDSNEGEYIQIDLNYLENVNLKDLEENNDDD